MDHDEAERHRTYLVSGIWVIATIALGAAAYVSRDILSPFALALLLWLVMEGLAREINRRLPKAVPRVVGHLMAIAIVIVSIVISINILRDAFTRFAEQYPAYEQRINGTIVEVYGWLGLANPPSIVQLLASEEGVSAIQNMLTEALPVLQGLLGNLVLVLIYVGFLYFAGRGWPTKMRNIFGKREDRRRALHVADDVRQAMEQYLWVQTLLSLITSTLTYFTLLAMGLDNALFWSFVIFFLNYIPTLGSIAASALPTVFALVQVDWPPWMPASQTGCAIIVLIGVSVWQFGIGNFVSPRLTGSRLNISPLTVLLSLAVWGGLWGPTGVFLSAPLTVLLMIVLNEVQGARWISVLLSDDGNPGGAKEEAVEHVREKDRDKDGGEKEAKLHAAASGDDPKNTIPAE